VQEIGGGGGGGLDQVAFVSVSCASQIKAIGTEMYNTRRHERLLYKHQAEKCYAHMYVYRPFRYA
jgi:hypothetical protein